MSMTGANSVDVLPEPLSMIVRTMSVEAGAISLVADTRPTAGSINVEVMICTSGTVTLVASKTITTGTDFTYLVQLLKFEVRCPLCQCLPRALPLEPAWYSLQS